MDVSVIIINYNTFVLTSECIRSVIQFSSNIQYEIILVDNASTECDATGFLKEFPQIKLIKSSVNGGFAYGNNLGILKASGNYILLLNSDTVLEKNSIAMSLRYARNVNAGVLGCRMIFPDRRIQYTARRFRSIAWELLDLFRFIPFMMPYKKRSGLMLGRYFKHDENIECDWVNGAFFMFEKKILDQLPGNKLDDRFFMYGEDQLWCYQIKKLGYKIYFFCETTIIHIHSGSTDLKKQLALRKIMNKKELLIMEYRKGKGIYYYLFCFVFLMKQYLIYLNKWLKQRLKDK